MRWGNTCSVSGYRPQDERPLQQGHRYGARCSLRHAVTAVRSGYLQIGFITSRARDAQTKIPQDPCKETILRLSTQRVAESAANVGAADGNRCHRSGTDQNKWAVRQPRVMEWPRQPDTHFGVHFADPEFLGRVDCDVFAPLIGASPVATEIVSISTFAPALLNRSRTSALGRMVNWPK